MGPISSKTDHWLPVEPPDRTAAGDLALHADKDRRGGRLAHRRRKPKPDPDADQFTESPKENLEE